MMTRVITVMAPSSRSFPRHDLFRCRLSESSSSSSPEIMILGRSAYYLWNINQRSPDFTSASPEAVHFNDVLDLHSAGQLLYALCEYEMKRKKSRKLQTERGRWTTSGEKGGGVVHSLLCVMQCWWSARADGFCAWTFVSLWIIIFSGDVICHFSSRESVTSRSIIQRQYVVQQFAVMCYARM